MQWEYDIHTDPSGRLLCTGSGLPHYHAMFVLPFAVRLVFAALRLIDDSLFILLITVAAPAGRLPVGLCYWSLTHRFGLFALVRRV